VALSGGQDGSDIAAEPERHQRVSNNLIKYPLSFNTIMDAVGRPDSPLERFGNYWLGMAGVTVLVGLSAFTVVSGDQPKLLVISWVAFVAMAGGTVVGARESTARPRGLVWGYGLASGAMVTSAAVFIVPPAIGQQPELGGFGLAAGLLVGFAGHTVGHRLTHYDLPIERTTAELSAHALTAGAIIGVIYASLPGIGLVLGLAIVSHKAPAGYAAARRLGQRDCSVVSMLFPSSGVGLAALAVAAVTPRFDPGIRALVFGFSAGIFLHVAMDFLPHCETGSDIHEAATNTGHSHEVLDTLRTHAVASTAVGAVLVALGWLVVT